MKKFTACIGLIGLVAAGCTSTDYRGAADDAQYSTPSWGTSTAVSNPSGYGYNAPGGTQTSRPPEPMGGERNFEDMTPQAGHDHGTAPQMPPTESDVKNNVPDFGTQHK